MSDVSYHEILGARIRVLQDGAEPSAFPVLFLHGNPDSAELWDDVVADLKTSFRCIRPDLPGFHLSQIPDGFDFSLDAMASFVDALVDRLDVGQPLHLVVHDFGGPYGLAWAIRHPERVARIAVIDSLFSSTLRWHFWARVWRTPGIGEISMKLMNRWIFRFELRRGGRELPASHIAETWERVTPEAMKMILKLYRATDPEVFRGWEDELKKLAEEHPVKVLWGKHDAYLGLDQAETFGTTDIEIHPTCGHWPPAEAPEWTIRHLRAHFE